VYSGTTSTITNYFYDGDSIRLLFETDGNDNIVRSYVYSADGHRLAMKTGGSTYYYEYNAHGDVIALTDSQGNVVASYSYDAWGNPPSGETRTGVKLSNPFRYAGYYFDEETGQYYVIARYYDSKHGVFLSQDPEPGDKDDLIGQNGYSYAGNNPVMNEDPNGHFFFLIVPLLLELGADAAIDAGIDAAVSYAERYAVRYIGKTGARIVEKDISKNIKTNGTSNFKWGNSKTLTDHFNRHGKDFKVKNAQDYAKKANDFFKNRSKYQVKVDSDRIIRVYDPKTNTFGSYNSNGTTKTFYKPTPKNYWKNQPGK
jgi:RHS repeat-associated protein